MVCNKLSILVLVAFAAYSVKADGGEITDWCLPCKRIIDDFTPELKTTSVQDVYDRACDDVFLEDQANNKRCHNFYDNLYSELRKALNDGKSAEEVCTELGVCGKSEPKQRQKFVKSQKFGQLFKNQFSKLF